MEAMGFSLKGRQRLVVISKLGSRTRELLNNIAGVKTCQYKNVSTHQKTFQIVHQTPTLRHPPVHEQPPGGLRQEEEDDEEGDSAGGDEELQGHHVGDQVDQEGQAHVAKEEREGPGSEKRK